MVEGLNKRLEVLEDGDEFIDALFLDQGNEFLTSGVDGLDIAETNVGGVEGEGIDLIEDSDINVARVEEGVEGFSGVVRSDQEVLDGDGFSGGLVNESLDFVGEFSSSSETSFEVDVQLSDSNLFRILGNGGTDQSE